MIDNSRIKQDEKGDFNGTSIINKSPSLGLRLPVSVQYLGKHKTQIFHARSLKIRAISEIRCLIFSLMLHLKYRSMKIYKPFVIPSLVLKVSSTYVIFSWLSQYYNLKQQN